MGSGIRFDETELEIGTCYPIQFVVSVFYTTLPQRKWIQNQKRQVFKQFLILSVWNLETNQLVKEGFS